MRAVPSSCKAARQALLRVWLLLGVEAYDTSIPEPSDQSRKHDMNSVDWWKSCRLLIADEDVGVMYISLYFSASTSMNLTFLIVNI